MRKDLRNKIILKILLRCIEWNIVPWRKWGGYRLNPELDRRNKFFEEQYWYAKTFLKNYLPFNNFENLEILEIGSAEGGTLKFFNELGTNDIAAKWYISSGWTFSIIFFKLS